MHGSILCHELGHALCGRAVGLRPYWIRIGQGPKLLKKTFFSVRLDWALWPTGGLTYANFQNLNWSKPTSVKLQLIVFILGGVLGNLFLFTIALRLYTQDPTAIACFFIVFEILLILAATIPSDGKIYGTRFPNDAKQLWNVAWGKWREYYATAYTTYEAAVTRYQPGIEMQPLFKNDQRKLQLLLEAEVRLSIEEIPEAVSLLKKLLRDETLSSSERAYLLDKLVSVVVIYRRSEYLDQANLWSKEALELFGDSKTLQGTRGAILIELGQYVQGKALLLPLVTADNDPIDIAFSSCYLAKADHALGNSQDAQIWLRRAEKIGQSIVGFSNTLAAIQKELRT